MAAPAQFSSIVDLQLQGRLDAAETALRAWIARRPGHAEAHGRLGMVLQAAGRQADALPFLETAARLEPGNPQPLCLLGVAYHALGRLEQAAASYRKAIAIAPRLARAYNNLGLVLRDQGELEAAVAVFQGVLSFEPEYATALANLGAVLADAGRDGEALEVFRAAVARAPQAFEAWLKLGMTLARMDRAGAAVASLETALRLQPGHANTLLQLALCLERCGRVEEAIDRLQESCAQHGIDLELRMELRMELARMLAGVNRTEQARAGYAAVLAGHPGKLKAAIGACLTLPLVCSSAADVERARERFGHGLAALEAMEIDPGAGRPGRLLSELAWVNFALAYQGQDDKALQARYGQWLTRLLRRGIPELMADRPRVARAGGRVRVGFVSSLFYQSTVGAYFASWVSGLDKDEFESFVYHTGARQDAFTRELAQACEHYLPLPLSGLDAGWRLARRIAADALDILVYPELGMTAALFPLAALRLAPVQCAAWGHPVTTGLPNIDYYLSSEPMEPPDAAAHYTERLIRLPGLGTRYRRPALPQPGSRADFGLPLAGRLILFPHAPFKIHPDNDALLAEIAARDPDTVFVLVQERNAAPARDVLARLARALAARGLSAAQRTVVLPYLPHDDYLRLNQLCDLMLDTLHWSGGNTTLDAIACGLPVVTLPGPTMRSRQSAAMLRMVGVEELIASDGDAYVESALRLAGDAAWRAGVRKRLGQGADALFGQPQALRALQVVLRDLANRPAAAS